MKNTVQISGADVPKKEILKWTKALRSGKYEQAKRKLQTKKGYCCLGVLCDISIPEDDKIKSKNGTLSGTTVFYQLNAPYWTKIINVDFLMKTHSSLIDLNDKEDLTFDEIADCIEAVYVHEVLS